MSNRLVITGMGAITPIGLNVDNYWNNLIKGECGVDYITLFDASRLPVHIAAEVRGYNPSDVLPRSVLKSSSRFMQFAYSAAIEAYEQSGLKNKTDRDRVAICIGSALSGAIEISKSGIDYLTTKTGKISAYLTPSVLTNITAAHLSINLGIHGVGLSISTACSSGGDAIITAAMLLQAQEADCVLIAGGESILTPNLVSSLAQAKSLSRRNDDPKKASRPFDLHRDGFVIGEGGGALVVETEEHAIDRGAKIYAVLSGWGNSLDAWHITAPDPEGKGAATCMRKALSKAGLCPADIDYINAHGTSTPLGDKAETKALKAVFGDKIPLVSSTKGATGHLIGAGGITEIIACIKAIENGIIPPTLNLQTSDPDCDLDYVPNISRKANIKTAMSNALGFGGQNSSIIVSRYE